MKRTLALVLAITLCLSTLTGCEGLVQKYNLQSKKQKETANLNETISKDSKWINSEIEGAIDENSELNLKDDFYSAYNKEWLLETKANDVHYMVNANKSGDITKLRLLSIIKNEEDADAMGDAPVPADYLEHDEKEVRILADAVMDWEARDAAGMDSLKKYTDYIESLDSIDDVKEYFIGNNGQNLMQLGLVSLNVIAPKIDAEHYYVYIGQINSASLSKDAYHNGASAAAETDRMDERTGYILRRLGYSDDQVKDIFTRCYKFESGMVDKAVALEYYSDNFYEKEECITPETLEDIKNMEGNYPLLDIIKACGYDAGNIVVKNPKYVKYIGEIINENNLENIKAFLLVNTVMDTEKLLDKEAYDYFKALEDRDNKLDEDEVADDIMSDMDKYYVSTVQKYLQGALDTIYVARYCNQAEKEDITKLTIMYVNKLREIFLSEEWISDDTKANAVEKLEAIKLRILYPDEFVSYDYIDAREDGSLIDIIADINLDKRGYDAELLGKNVDRLSWDMDEVEANTTIFNCGYRPSLNNISICAGFVSDKGYYNIDMSSEEKFGKIGAVIGHELTHAFDNNGAQYDKYGYKNNWWNKTDLGKFDSKNSKIGVYYMALSPYPGKTYGAVGGVKVEGEVAADLGGIKCSLELGKEIENFDNKAFFEYFMDGYKQKVTPKGARVFDGNEHPINCIRANVDVMQFDEFQEAFDIKEGDGMYLAPEDRITIW